MGILDKAKAFAHVGLNKAGRAGTDAAAKGVHKGTDAAAKGASSLNEAAGKLRDAADDAKSEPGERPQDGAAPR